MHGSQRWDSTHFKESSRTFKDFVFALPGPSIDDFVTEFIIKKCEEHLKCLSGVLNFKDASKELEPHLNNRQKPKKLI